MRQGAWVLWLGWVLAALIWLLGVLLLGRARKAEGPSTHVRVAPDDAEVGLVVTLVHGTWGWFSTWLHERSRLRCHLEETFPGRVEFCRVNWSGLNSFRARRKGAASLRRQIRENAGRWPAARQVVVAHSHGGSLSIEALNDDDCLKSVDGLVCMATPFLTLTRFRQPLRAPFLPQFLFDSAAVYAIAILVFALTYWLLPESAWQGLAANVRAFYNWLEPKDLLNQSFGEALVGILGVIGLPLIVIGLLGWLAKQWAGHYESVVVAALQDSRIEPDKLLILRQPGDEASGAIAGLHAATLPLGFIIKLITSLIAPIMAASRRAKATRFGRHWVSVWGLVSAGAVSAVALLIVERARSVGVPDGIGALLPMTLFSALYAGWILGAALSAVTSVSALLHIVSLVPAVFSVGPEMLFAGSRLKVTAEAAPIGAWRIITIPMRARLGKDRPLFGDLWHSYLYESEAAITEIGAWLQKLLGLQGTAAAETTRVASASST